MKVTHLTPRIAGILSSKAIASFCEAGITPYEASLLFLNSVYQRDMAEQCARLEAILGQKFVAIPTIPDNPDNSQLQRQHLFPVALSAPNHQYVV